MEQSHLNWITGYIWGIADDVLRDLYVGGKYRDVILPRPFCDALMPSWRTVSRRCST